MWFGINDRGTENRFEWTDGSPVAYLHWGNGKVKGQGLKLSALMVVLVLVADAQSALCLLVIVTKFNWHASKFDEVLKIFIISNIFVMETIPLFKFFYAVFKITYIVLEVKKVSE